MRAITRGGTNVPLKVLLAAEPGPVLRGLTTYFRPGPFCGDLRIPHPLQLVAGGPLAPPQTPPSRLEKAPSPLRPVAGHLRGRRNPVQARSARDHPIPLPGNTDTVAVDQSRRPRRRMTQRHVPVESRMRGEHARPVRRAGPGKRTDREIGQRAPARSLLRAARRRDPLPRAGSSLSKLGHSQDASSRNAVAPTPVAWPSN